MSESDRFDALMLEHLYGLLDPDEARELQAYLATPAGDELRGRAEQMQAKLTGAARTQFPKVQFVPPAKTAVIKPLAKPAPPGARCR